MKSVHTEEYHELFAKLPQNVQKQARKANRLFEVNPYYPSLRLPPSDVHPPPTKSLPHYDEDHESAVGE